MVRRATSLDSYDRRRQGREECRHLRPVELGAQDDLLGGAHAMKLEYLLRRIHANARNLIHGRFLF